MDIWLPPLVSDPRFYDPNHYLITSYPGPSSQPVYLMTFSGNLRLDLDYTDPTTHQKVTPYQGVSSDTWRWDKVHFTIPFPPEAPAGKSFQLIHWTPFVTLNSIFNAGESINAGWAVDNFGLALPPGYPPVVQAIPIWADIAVRDSDGYIYKLGYNVTVVGRFVDSPPI